MTEKQQICVWCKQPMKGENGDIFYDGWYHKDCRIARRVYDRLNPKPIDFSAIGKGMEVRAVNKFVIARKDL